MTILSDQVGRIPLKMPKIALKDVHQLRGVPDYQTGDWPYQKIFFTHKISFFFPSPRFQQQQRYPGDEDEESPRKSHNRSLSRTRSLVTIPVSPRLHTKERAKARTIRSPEKKNGEEKVTSPGSRLEIKLLHGRSLKKTFYRNFNPILGKKASEIDRIFLNKLSIPFRPVISYFSLVKIRKMCTFSPKSGTTLVCSVLDCVVDLKGTDHCTNQHKVLDHHE